MPDASLLDALVPLPKTDSVRMVLNTGSGGPGKSRLHKAFHSRRWREIRLDIDPAVRPDIVGTIQDLGRTVKASTFDAIYSSHILEHLPAFEVVPALVEFRRALKPEGFALVTCPDVSAICRLVLERGLDAQIYDSPAGPITPLDMLFGHGRSIKQGNTFMCHRSGFTEETLGKVGLRAGFAEVRVAKGDGIDIWALLLTPKTDRDMVRAALSDTPQDYLLH